jgi:pyridoxal phosphate enzyme (YggS family)
MSVNTSAYKLLKTELDAKHVTLVAVSKTKPLEDIKALYDLGQRDFGENYVQELIEKQALLPPDIRWHFIGHLQSNKVKYIAPFVHLIHGVDSLKLLLEIDKQGRKINRVLSCLLQVHIAQEETKFGLSDAELDDVLEAIHKYKLMDQLTYASVTGLMGMASLSSDPGKVAKEFKYLKLLYDKYAARPTVTYSLTTLSMGMSADYALAVQEGSTLVRIGSLLFGSRQ